MIYILSIGTAFLTTALTSIFMIKSGYFVFDKGETLTPIEIPTDNETQKAHAKEAEAEISEADSADESAKQTDMSQNGTESVRADKSSAFYGRSQSFMAIMLMLIVSMLVNYLLYTYTIVQNTDHMYNLFAKMALTHAMTICAALTDAKRNKIPNAIIAFGLGARAVLYVAEFMFYNDGFTAMLKNDILGFIIGFVMLFIIAFISKGGIGYGDIKLFGVIGLMAGSAGVYLTLLLSLVLSSITALVLMAMHKKTIKSALPMAPFICIAFMAICIFGIF